MRKVILGDGISARIFAFYNPEYIRIAPPGGSQVDSKDFQLSLILPKTAGVDEFFADLGFAEPPETVDLSIGWYEGGEFFEGNPPQEIRRRILEKKLRGFEPTPSLFSPEAPSQRSSIYFKALEPFLVKGRDVMTTYGIRMPELLGRVGEALPAGRLVSGTVGKIDEKRITLDSGEAIEYSHLVSTIPAPAFWSIYGGPHAERKQFLGFPLYVAAIRRHIWDGMGYPNLPERVMCYFPEDRFDFDRVRLHPELQDDLVSIESPVPFDGATVLPSARIIRSYDNVPPPRVMFLGRYAQWDSDVVVADVIRKSSQKYVAESIWSDQKAFNRRFVNYAPDSFYVQSVVKDYILHLISETYSLLNTINWKIAKEGEALALDRERILEEFIDIFKFWLSIGHMFGFTVDDFVRMYWKKSEIVEKRFPKGGAQ